MYEYFGNNILGDLNLILLNIPDNLTDMEKLRWLYINAGKCFSYNFKVITDNSIIDKKIDYASTYISRYQTCVQISDIFANMIGIIGNGIKAYPIDRVLESKGRYGTNHKAVAVEFATGEKYILDLTLDLYLIQSGCKTKNFGFATDATNQYDIISLKECEMMDKKLGLVGKNGYTDSVIDEVINEINNIDFSLYSNKEKRYEIMQIINEKLDKNFYGMHEKKQYFNLIFRKIFTNETYREFNLVHEVSNDTKLAVCCLFDEEGDKDLYIYGENMGITPTTFINVRNMISTSWKTSSKAIMEFLDMDTKQK